MIFIFIVRLNKTFLTRFLSKTFLTKKLYKPFLLGFFWCIRFAVPQHQSVAIKVKGDQSVQHLHLLYHKVSSIPGLLLCFGSAFWILKRQNKIIEVISYYIFFLNLEFDHILQLRPGFYHECFLINFSIVLLAKRQFTVTGDRLDNLSRPSKHSPDFTDL